MQFPVKSAYVHPYFYVLLVAGSCKCYLVLSGYEKQKCNKFVFAVVVASPYRPYVVTSKSV